MKILVVEDESYSRDSLVVQLKTCDLPENLQILEAENGKVGLKLFKEQLPDVVVSDINMPLLSGLELLQKALLINKDTIFIMISGYADFKFAQQALNSGAKAYLLKPIRKEELQEVILKHIPIKTTTQNANQPLEKDDMLIQHIEGIISLDEAPNNPIKDIVFNKIFSVFCFAVFLFDTANVPTKNEFGEYIRRTSGTMQIPDYRVLSINQRCYGLLVQGRYKGIEFVSNIAGIAERFNKGCRVGISPEYSGIEQLKKAYEEGVRAVSNKFFYNSQIMLYDKVSCEHNVKFTPSENDLQLFDLWLKKADEQNAIKAVKKIIETMDAQGNIAISSYEHTFGRIKSIFYDNAMKVLQLTKLSLELLILTVARS